MNGFCCAARDPSWINIQADDLNARFKELVGDDYSVKDLRTWHGTVLAAAAFADADPAVSQRVAKRVEAAVMREVAEELGNTPAVARGSYVDPRVVTGYEQGMTIATAARRAERARRPDAALEILEKATRMLIRRVAKSDSASGTARPGQDRVNRRPRPLSSSPGQLACRIVPVRQQI